MPTNSPTVALMNGYYGEIYMITQYFATKAAVSVLYEDPETENHSQRVLLAKRILDGSFNFNPMTYAVMGNSVIAADPEALDLDQSIEFVVNSVYEAFALTY